VSVEGRPKGVIGGKAGRCRVVDLRGWKQTGMKRRSLQEMDNAKTSRISHLQRGANKQAEAARTRGTPLTPQAFQEWRIRFTNELKQKRDKEEDERIRALPPKEREDVRKRRERLSGGSFPPFLFPISSFLLSSFLLSPLLN
jgi:hypothetical protein